jgi:hypothetical protein
LEVFGSLEVWNLSGPAPKAEKTGEEEVEEKPGSKTHTLFKNFHFPLSTSPKS